MSLNFSAFEGKNIFKFAKYEIKEIGKTKYIVPDSINKKHSSGAPLIDIEKDFEESILIDLLNSLVEIIFLLIGFPSTRTL